MNRESPQATILIAAGIFILLVFFNFVGVLRPLEAIVGFIVSPITKTLHLDNGSKLKKENEDLRAKVGDLTSQLAKREEDARLNDALRTQLNFAQSNNYKLVGADIISQDPTNYRQYLTINKGTAAGIQKGQVVVTQGQLVGRITETTPTTAKVYLITDFNSAVPVIDQQTRATGLVRGQRGFGLTLAEVPQTDQLKEGDTLITSGFGGEYPKGLVLGTLGSVHQRASDVYQSADIRPAIEFRKLEVVFTITGTI